MRPDRTTKCMIVLYDNADMREIFSSRSDLVESMAGLLEEIRQSDELVATEALANGGYPIVDCETNERAVEIAAEWPSARFGPIEVRPILDVGGADL